MKPSLSAFRFIRNAIALLLGLALSTTAWAGNQRQAAPQASSNVALTEQAFAAWAAGTGGPFTLLADDASWTITGNSLAAGTYPRREAFMREVIRPFNARMSVGLKPRIHNLYADGDTVVVLFDASGTARDGLPYTNTYAWFLSWQGGRIVKATAFFDALAFNALWTRVSPQAGAQ